MAQDFDLFIHGDDSDLFFFSERETEKSDDKEKTWKHMPPDLLDAFDNRQWHAAQDNLACLLREEYRYVYDEEGYPVEPEPIGDYRTALDLCTSRYIHYILIIRQLDECYQYLVHPQKRKLVRTCIEGAAVRLLEFKEQMVELDLREFQFYDTFLHDLSLTPPDIVIEVPKFFLAGRAALLRTREMMLTSILVKHFPDRFQDAPLTESMSVGEAILLIQRNQRAFVDRTKSKKKKLHVLNRANMAYWAKLYDSGTASMNTICQKYAAKWRAYYVRRGIGRMREDEMVKLGMLPDYTANDKVFTQRDEHLYRNQKIALENEQALEEDTRRQEQMLLNEEGPSMAESLRQTILQWILELRDLTGKFPVFPEESQGGSNALFKNKALEEVETDILDWLEEQESGKKKKGGKKEGKKKKKKEKKKKKKKKKGEGEEFEWVMPESEGLPVLREAENTYCDYWYWKDETNNQRQVHDLEILKEDLRRPVGETIRKEVDDLMRVELDRLRYAIDHQKKGKEPTGKKGKDKTGGKRKKANKDLTKDRTIDDLYEELVTGEIIIPSQHIRINDFLGEHFYVGCTMENEGLEPLPSLAVVRRLITELALIPLGSAAVHERAPLNRSMLIAGLRETGKKMLVHSICYEVGANLFNLTPSNLAGKYEGKKGQQMLMHMIMKVGKAMEPSVFWVGDCEQLFLSKKDKKDPAKPARWASILPKTIKKIKNGDRMMLVGTTSRPYLAKPKPLTKCFQRVVFVPRPDYASRLLLWKYFIAKHCGSQMVSHDLDISSLTKVTNGYTAFAIQSACAEVLTETRMKRLNRRGNLRASEFIERIATYEPIYVEEEAAVHDWYMKTPLAKKRLKRRQEEEGYTGGKGKKKKKGKGKKKKK
ncbi:dynein regulatory complex protein 11 [Aplysia californica]|uniref:Dynein regulatory complex protein 11 n=1 Tax=Aplysia californica TaxID=6500 RepID=A0ABM0K1S5_APLCA|nr:dynein regulatory complex protein 11 [Aplysia californica]